MTYKLLRYSFIILLSISALVFSDISTEAVKSAINLCMTGVVPSIFPFLVLSTMILNSSLSRYIENFFAPFIKFCFALPKAAAIPFLTGLLCGFPIGAKTAGDLYNNGNLTKKQTEYLIMFCNNTGPSFIVGAIGISVFSSARIGFYLYIIQALSAIFTGVILRFFRKYEKTDFDNLRYPIINDRFTKLFCDSVFSAVKSCGIICGFIIFFSFIVNLLVEPIRYFTYNKLIFALITGAFEFTRGIYSLVGVDFSSAFIASGVIICWSGFSVHFQTAALLSDHKLSLNSYFVGKLICTSIACIFCLIFNILIF